MSDEHLHDHLADALSQMNEPEAAEGYTADVLAEAGESDAAEQLDAEAETEAAEAERRRKQEMTVEFDPDAVLAGSDAAIEAVAGDEVAEPDHAAVFASLDDETVEDEAEAPEEESGEGFVGDGSMMDQPVAAAAPIAAARRSTAGRTAAGPDIKAVAAPVLITVGCLLLVPALWGAMILAGADVPMAERGGAKMMALVMQAAWPIALFLFFGAGMFIAEIRKRKAKQRKLEERR